MPFSCEYPVVSNQFVIGIRETNLTVGSKLHSFVVSLAGMLQPQVMVSAKYGIGAV